MIKPLLFTAEVLSSRTASYKPDLRDAFLHFIRHIFAVGVNSVAITGIDDGFGSGIDRVEVRFPDTLAPGHRPFARLAVQ